jgi:type IV secretory pathway TrbD component
MQQQNNNDLMRYAGMGAQIFASLGIAVFVGYKIDKWLAMSFPILVWLLPVLVLTIFIYKLIKETKPKN